MWSSSARSMSMLVMLTVTERVPWCVPRSVLEVAWSVMLEVSDIDIAYHVRTDSSIDVAAEKYPLKREPLLRDS